MTYDIESFYGESILFTGTGPAPEQEFFYGESILDWQLSEGIIFDAVSLDGVNTI